MSLICPFICPHMSPCVPNMSPYVPYMSLYDIQAHQLPLAYERKKSPYMSPNASLTRAYMQESIGGKTLVVKTLVVKTLYVPDTCLYAGEYRWKDERCPPRRAEEGPLA